MKKSLVFKDLECWFNSGYEKKVLFSRTSSVGSIVVLKKKFYSHFCDIYLEMIKLDYLNEKQIKDRFKVLNPELADKYLSEGKSVILMVSHYGGYEWCTTLDMYFKHQVAAIYTPLKDKELEKNVKVTSGGVGMTSSEKTYTKAEIEALNSGASLDASGNVIPINKNENKATQISDVPEDKPEIITLPMGGATGGGQGVSAPAQKTSNALPTINFDTNNPHTLYATSVTGAGN